MGCHHTGGKDDAESRNMNILIRAQMERRR